MFPRLFYLTPQRADEVAFQTFGLKNVRSALKLSSVAAAKQIMSQLFQGRGSSWQPGVEFRSDGVEISLTHLRPKAVDPSAASFTTNEAKKKRKAKKTNDSR